MRHETEELTYLAELADRWDHLTPEQLKTFIIAWNQYLQNPNSEKHKEVNLENIAELIDNLQFFIKSGEKLGIESMNLIEDILSLVDTFIVHGYGIEYPDEEVRSTASELHGLILQYFNTIGWVKRSSPEHKRYTEEKRKVAPEPLSWEWVKQKSDTVLRASGYYKEEPREKSFEEIEQEHLRKAVEEINEKIKRQKQWTPGYPSIGYSKEEIRAYKKGYRYSYRPQELSNTDSFEAARRAADKIYSTKWESEG